VRAFADTLERSVDERTQELAQARDSLAIALEAAEMGSWDFDLASDTSRRTLRHDEIFGYRQLQPQWGRATFLDHVSPDDRDRIRQLFDEAPRSGRLEFECRIIAADRKERWISAQGRVQYDTAGAPVRITGVLADVTRKKDADAQLAQAQKMDTIGQLTGGVAHDFNNLLTPIVGSLDLLRRRIGDDVGSQRLIAAAQQAAERAATLTQRLLSFSRRQTLQPRAVNAGELIGGIVDLMSRSLGPTIEVVVDAPGNMSAARVDPNQLELALLNLAVNARDAMPNGGRLAISAREDSLKTDNEFNLPAGPYVRITTRDQGVGMDAATLARAVDPFFSTKGLGKGTGLGLSMAHGLAAQSGGALRLRSAPGKGTTVDLWLPATEAVEATASESGPVLRPPTGSAVVLLVDDEDLVRKVTADIIVDLGYSVVEAVSGANAISLLNQGAEVDLIVSDYLMPGMTGAGLVAELRQRGYRAPLLLITGYANAAEDVPADVPRLGKPFRQVDLACRLDDLLAHARAEIGRPPLRPVSDDKVALDDGKKTSG
jgi:signal transduction histidine kinase